MEKFLQLSVYGEMYIIELNKVLFFEADDHYTHVYLSQGNTFLVPFGLLKIEEKLAEIGAEAAFLQRMGRRHIINLRRIYHLNVIKQHLLLADDHGNTHTLQLSKPVLRHLMNIFGGNSATHDD